MDSPDSKFPSMKTPFRRKNWLTLYLLLLFLGPQALAQQAVTGTVTDAETGESLPGVNILIKGTTTGTTSDIDGGYNLSVGSQQAVLVFSFVGYDTKEVVVGNLSQINVSLDPDLSELNEVVVVGYGTVKKSSVTSAISKIENDKLDQIPAGRPETALVGRMAGVNISTNRSTPGAAPIIRIRGAGSISASNDPLVVIDGFAGGSLSNVNMNDVESIEVLKDASSAAIYGSRGAGGVIIVTTKKGRSGKAKLSINSYVGVSNAIPYNDWIYGQEFYDYQVRYKNRDFVREGGDPTIPMWGDDRRPATYRVNPVIKEGSYNWEDILLSPAPMQNYNVSISGGNEHVTYYLSGTIKDEQGTLLNTWYKNYSLRANVEAKINNVLSAGLTMSPNFSRRRTSPLTMEAIIKTSPFVSPEKNPDGSYPRPLDYWGTSVSAQVSPLASLYGTHNYSESMNNIGEVYIGLNLAEGLSLRSSLGTNITYTTGENYSAAEASSNSLTSGSASDARSINIINENVLSYNKELQGGHSLSAILGASYQKSGSRSSVMAAVPGSFGNNIVRTLNNAIINPAGTRTSKSQWGLSSYFARLNYGYKEKYLLSASFRTDGSSRFGPENRWGYFPSASVAWRVSEEAFFQSVPLISELKLRSSYGVVGNFNIGDFQYLGTIADTYYSPDGTVVKGQAQSTFGNPALKWERTESVDFGVELGLFDNRVNIVFDYYTKRTNDLLYNVSIPATSGFTNTIVNVGDISNKGIELELNTHNIEGAFNWSTSFNLTKNRNEVLDLGGVDEVINTHTRGMSWLLRLGEPMFSYYGYKLIGVLQNAEDVANSPTLPGSTSGNAKYQDTNNDGVITPEDRVILGNFQPKLLLGMVNDFSWKDFDLSFALQASLGAKMYNLENLYYEGPTVSAMRKPLIENQWWSEQEPGDGMSPSTALSALAYVANSDYYLEDASFLALRNINLGYTLPSHFLSKLKMSNCRVYISGTNLLVITAKEFNGYNPEGYTGGEINGIGSMPGFNNGTEPINRTYAIGLNLNF
jgi:TonB-linked SusC/RagA family outer membrane protein